MFYYQGVADPLILWGRARQYHDEAAAVMGKEKLDQTARFFMVPGHGHCWEKTGQVADDSNPLAIIDRWAESGQPPDYVIAEQVGSDPFKEKTRKLCPYPLVARFHGGDPNNAESYSCKGASR